MDAEQQISTEATPAYTPPPRVGRWKKGRERFAQLDKGPGTFERPKYLLMLGRNLRRWRQQRKVTMKALAKAVGCNARTILFVESPEPRAIRHYLIARVAEATGVPAPILMLDQDDLTTLCEHLVEIHGEKALFLAVSKAIMQRDACTSAPPAV